MKEIADHLRGTLEILNQIRAEPDVLLAIGAAISRLEDVIEILKGEGGGNGRNNETEDQNQREADIEGGMVFRCDSRDGRCRLVSETSQRSDPENGRNIHCGGEDTREVEGRLTEPLPTRGSA
jgi:hypothetical protein